MPKRKEVQYDPTHPQKVEPDDKLVQVRPYVYTWRDATDSRASWIEPEDKENADALEFILIFSYGVKLGDVRGYTVIAADVLTYDDQPDIIAGFGRVTSVPHGWILHAQELPGKIKALEIVVKKGMDEGLKQIAKLSKRKVK